MELVEHMFFSCLLTQQVWHYAVNIFWQLCVKRGNHGPWKSMMQCLFDQPLNKFLNPSTIVVEL